MFQLDANQKGALVQIFRGETVDVLAPNSELSVGLSVAIRT